MGEYKVGDNFKIPKLQIDDLVQSLDGCTITITTAIDSFKKCLYKVQFQADAILDKTALDSLQRIADQYEIHPTNSSIVKIKSLKQTPLEHARALKEYCHSISSVRPCSYCDFWDKELKGCKLRIYYPQFWELD